MKKPILFFVICLLNLTNCFSQDIQTNYSHLSKKPIEQISSSAVSSIMDLQNMNHGLNSMSVDLQSGNQNQLFISQSKDPLSGLPNQSYNYQMGNSNELSLDQVGSGNLLLSFQFGYLTVESFLRISSQYELNLKPLIGNSITGKLQKENYQLGSGEGNKIEVTQEGNENGILAVQEGDDNLISVGQKGNNNYLLVVQKGNENSVTGYKQENNSDDILYDSIIQEGENLSVFTDGVARTSPVENIFCQTGKNLSIDVHTEFLNSSEGIEVRQKGRDMKIVIDQSYFPKPR